MSLVPNYSVGYDKFFKVGDTAYYYNVLFQKIEVCTVLSVTDKQMKIYGNIKDITVTKKNHDQVFPDKKAAYEYCILQLKSEITGHQKTIERIEEKISKYEKEI